ncbi:unnamed protein product [Aphanomyces euteiches]|uniref:Cysteine/serine-rich nuclear protein N-terminal domain-containing protein n=1 Tax=Aphanomyces euteiches TaxID=100861 RepID=A0A6G0WST4_9STRA|nr:hypothetical protein Ae201684_011946 [Aphanomyces euteiches]KAH9056097.1 hypothetical protein Ae201684P_021835 [Aphanomyces euteiches]KAH9139043.1 hypothetical protein AeRB84_016639 [Aphanomyces euteiches]
MVSTTVIKTPGLEQTTLERVEMQEAAPDPARRAKRVSFTTATTYVFPLEYGGSAVPKEHGPPIGLAKTHSHVECTTIKNVKSKRGRVRKFDHVERMLLLQQLASYSRKEVAMFCFDAIAIRRSRIETEDDDENEESNEDLAEREPKRRKTLQ